jgi:hypothetical protein
MEKEFQSSEENVEKHCFQQYMDKSHLFEHMHQAFV